MDLSTDTLFHFSNFGSILNILRSQVFWPVYNLERFSSEYYENHRYAIPMVCFCDLAFNLTENHRNEYGLHAIGLKKAWAIENKLNPVSYQLEQSSFTSANESLIQLLSMLTDSSTGDELSGALQKAFLPQEILNNQIKSVSVNYLIHKFLLTVHAYKKPYKSKKFDKREMKFLNENVSYYDEREWRYIPEMYPNNIEKYEILKTNDCHKSVINEETYYNVSIKRKYQDYINLNYALKFLENDINEIIVKNDEERIEIQEKLRGFYTDEFLKISIKTYNELNF